jgi:hypothetical protein
VRTGGSRGKIIAGLLQTFKKSERGIKFAWLDFDSADADVRAPFAL